jgi:DegV family protein with EDD domain
MGRVCILTDGTAQFTCTEFPGYNLVKVVSFEAQPALLQPGGSPNLRLSGRTADDFLNQFQLLGTMFREIMVITVSSALSPVTWNVSQAVARYNGRANVGVVDSQTTGIGLGLLVQLAAEAAAAGMSLAEIDRLVRIALQRVYTLICIPSLTILAESGYLTHAQATVGEMLGLLPIFSIDEGTLVPMGKVRTQRHLLDSFQEFIEEFNNPDYIAFLKPQNGRTFHTRPLREYVRDSFPDSSFSEHVLNANLAAMFGPQSMGVVVMDLPKESYENRFSD